MYIYKKKLWIPLYNPKKNEEHILKEYILKVHY